MSKYWRILADKAVKNKDKNCVCEKNKKNQSINQSKIKEHQTHFLQNKLS